MQQRNTHAALFCSLVYPVALHMITQVTVLYIFYTEPGEFSAKTSPSAVIPFFIFKACRLKINTLNHSASTLGNKILFTFILKLPRLKAWGS